MNQNILRVLIKTIAWAFILAVFTEMLQAMLPIGRNGNLYDGIADIFGAGLGCLFFWIFRKKSNILISKQGI